MAEKKKDEAVVPQRMGKAAGKELFEIDPKKVQWTIQRIDALVRVVKESYIELCRLLYEVWEGELYRSLGFDRFEEYVTDHLEWGARKGKHFVSIYKNLVVMGESRSKIPAKVIQERESMIEDLGWTRARILSELPVPERTPKKLPSWVERAKSDEVSGDDLQVEVRKAKNEDLGKKVYSEEVNKKVTFGLYEDQERNVGLALEVAQKVSGSEVKSNNLDLMATEFLAQRAEEAGVKLKRHLDNLERVFSCKIVAFSEDGEKVLYGAKVAKQYGIS